MGIEEKIYHIASCDICDDAFITTESRSHTPYETREQLIRAMRIAEWVVTETRTICPSCEENTRQIHYP